MEDEASALLVVHLLMYLVDQLGLAQVLLDRILQHRLIQYLIIERVGVVEAHRVLQLFAAKCWTPVTPVDVGQASIAPHLLEHGTL